MTTGQFDQIGLNSTPSGEERSLARTAKVSSVMPIEGADAIESAKVGGWTVVVKKGEFVAGDTAVYFEIDSALPLDDERFEFLAPRGEKTVNDRRCHVLKTARLRGVYSQGLLLPLSQFPEIPAGADDVTSLLGITKYEPTLPANMNVVGVFSSQFGLKTDSERAQNLTDEWADIVAAGPWLATEKVDGTSLSVFRDTGGTLRVNSRNWELKAPGEGQDPNLYWRAVLDNNLGDLIGPGEGIQAEIAGPGVQGNPLGIESLTVIVFAVLSNGVPLPRDQWPTFTSKAVIAAPIYDLTLADNAEQAVENVNGIKSLISKGRLAEGVVWHRESGQPIDILRGRSNFKTISNKYLLKNGG